MLIYARNGGHEPAPLNNKFDDINYQHDIIKYSRWRARGAIGANLTADERA